MLVLIGQSHSEINLLNLSESEVSEILNGRVSSLESDKSKHDTILKIFRYNPNVILSTVFYKNGIYDILSTSDFIKIKGINAFHISEKIKALKCESYVLPVSHINFTNTNNVSIHMVPFNKLRLPPHTTFNYRKGFIDFALSI